MVVHSLKPGPAGSVLRTTGEPRRGRCEKRIGADCLVSAAASVHRGQCSVIAISSGPAPHRFAQAAAPLAVRPTLAASVRSGARSGIFRSIHARPRSAHAPGRSGSVILSVLVDPSAIVPSMNAPTTARVAAGDSPVGPTHAPRRPLTCHPARFTTVARAHNPACSGLRVAARRSPLTHVG